MNTTKVGFVGTGNMGGAIDMAVSGKQEHYAGKHIPSKEESKRNSKKRKDKKSIRNNTTAPQIILPSIISSMEHKQLR